MEHQSFSRSGSPDSMSSIGFSQPDFDEFGNLLPNIRHKNIIHIDENKHYVLKDDATVVSGILSNVNTFIPDPVEDNFAKILNNAKNILQGEIEEHTVAEELTTGITNVPEEGNELEKQISISVSNYIEHISNIEVHISPPQSLSLAQKNTDETVISTTQSVLDALKTKHLVDAQIASVLDSKRKKEKYTIGVEVIDFTWAKTSWKLRSVEEILKQNNRFGILKFACANNIPINGQFHKLFYFQKELEWMLEQDPTLATVKGGTRMLRKITVDACTQNPLALELFDVIYKKMCMEGLKTKICAVGGNVLRAFFLALKIAKNWDGYKKTLCSTFDKWSGKNVRIVGVFANTLEHLETLCNKSSDADFTGFEKINDREKKIHGPFIQEALRSLCLKPSSICEGSIEFPLLRLKIKMLFDEQSFAEKCGGVVLEKTKTLRLANSFFPEIKWFPQMIPDGDVAELDKLYESKSAKLDPKDYIEIRKLYCVLKQIKLCNAILTTTVADILTEGDTALIKYNKLLSFVTMCCEHFSYEIESANIKSGVSDDIIMIVEKIIPSANNALLSLLQNTRKNSVSSLIKIVLDKVCNYEKLMEKKMIIATDATNGDILWSKSTSISVGNNNVEISNIQKMASFNGRTFFNSLSPEHHFKKNLCITINTLAFKEPTKSIEDIKDAEQPHIDDGGGGGGGRLIKGGKYRNRKSPLSKTLKKRKSKNNRKSRKH